MEGYDESTYGERFVDVYDDWYGSITDTDACVGVLASLANHGAVLELGVGTGRLAIPLAARGLAVTGVDSSPAMLKALAAKDPRSTVAALLGDMTDPPTGSQRFSLAFVGYNTFFNLVRPGAQEACFLAMAERLVPNGAFVVETFVAEEGFGATDLVAPKEVTANKVVLSVTQSRPQTQEILGQYVDITPTGISLRPWHIRWATITQLDAMAARAGLTLTERWAGWDQSPFEATSGTHVSVYQRHQ